MIRAPVGQEKGWYSHSGRNDPMKVKLIAAVVAGLALAPCALIAQAPAGATGKCKDGTYTTAATKSGACKGHKGVDTWLAATPAKGSSSTSSSTTPAAPASAAKPASTSSASTPASKPASTPAASTTPAASSSAPSSSSKSTKAPKTVAPGGGPGLVWLNTSSKVYHCYGGADYGTTKAGKYLSEADAKAAGGHAAGGKACSAK
jgi:hypothetical protein